MARDAPVDAVTSGSRATIPADYFPACARRDGRLAKGRPLASGAREDGFGGGVAQEPAVLRDEVLVRVHKPAIPEGIGHCGLYGARQRNGGLRTCVLREDLGNIAVLLDGLDCGIRHAAPLQ